jgi:hypothetical protein
MPALQMTTLSVNGQHLTVPIPAQPRTQWMRSRLAASVRKLRERLQKCGKGLAWLSE